jgi:hypothetical protein
VTALPNRPWVKGSSPRLYPLCALAENKRVLYSAPLMLVSSPAGGDVSPYLDYSYKVPFSSLQLLILRYLRMSGRPKSAHAEVSKCRRSRRSRMGAECARLDYLRFCHDKCYQVIIKIRVLTQTAIIPVVGTSNGRGVQTQKARSLGRAVEHNSDGDM